MGMITDEQFDAAWKAYKGHDLRAALEAIAPELIAQGMEKAADMCLEEQRETVRYDCAGIPIEEIKRSFRSGPALAEAVRASVAQLRESKP